MYDEPYFAEQQQSRLPAVGCGNKKSPPKWGPYMVQAGLRAP